MARHSFWDLEKKQEKHEVLSLSVQHPSTTKQQQNQIAFWEPGCRNSLVFHAFLSKTNSFQWRKPIPGVGSLPFLDTLFNSCLHKLIWNMYLNRFCCMGMVVTPLLYYQSTRTLWYAHMRIRMYKFLYIRIHMYGSGRYVHIINCCIHICAYTYVSTLYICVYTYIYENII